MCCKKLRKERAKCVTARENQRFLTIDGSNLKDNNGGFVKQDTTKRLPRRMLWFFVSVVREICLNNFEKLKLTSNVSPFVR